MNKDNNQELRAELTRLRAALMVAANDLDRAAGRARAALRSDAEEPATVQADQEIEPRCGGTRMLLERDPRGRDPRDPDYLGRDWDCPGCPDCEGS